MPVVRVVVELEERQPWLLVPELVGVLVTRQVLKTVILVVGLELPSWRIEIR